MTEQEKQYPTVVSSLAEFYGVRYTSLPEGHRTALIEDVVGMMVEEGLGSLPCIALLDKRINSRLTSYTNTLVRQAINKAGN